MKKCRNCGGGQSVKKPPVTRRDGESSKVTTIIGRKPSKGGLKTKI